MNLVMISGTLADEPKYYPAKPGRPVVTLLDLRCRNPRTGKHNDWHKIFMRGRVADAAGRKLQKGMKITVIGQLEWAQWKDKETGKWRKRAQVLGHAVKLDFHQWSEDWLELALRLAAETTQAPEEEIDSAEEGA